MRIGELVGRLDRLPNAAYTGTAYRHVAPGRSPLSGDGARLYGGRWNPPDSFATLYLGLDRQTVIDEFHRLARRQGLQPADFLPRDFYEYEVKLGALLDLRTTETVTELGLSADDLRSDDLQACQTLGEAVHLSGREGILAPSAAGGGAVLAVFLDRLLPASAVRDINVEVWDTSPDSAV